MAGVSQAYICWAAAYTMTKAMSPNFLKDYPAVNDTNVHAIANKMDDCTSYGSFKYISDEDLDFLNEKFGMRRGAGVYAYWRFRDGSRLFITSGILSRYAIEDPDGQIVERTWENKSITFRESKIVEVNDAAS